METSKKVIWSNEIDYKFWEDAGLPKEKIEDFATWVCDSHLSYLRKKYNKNINGCIIAFANLGLWYGRKNGAKIIGCNLSRIFYSSSDETTWYADRYNIRAKMVHHDGTNYVLYRITKDKASAERLLDKIASGQMNEKEFMRATKSLKTLL